MTRAREIGLTESSAVTGIAEGIFYTALFTPRSLRGRCGEGDTCFSTYIAMRLSRDPAEACRWAEWFTVLKRKFPVRGKVLLKRSPASGRINPNKR